MTTPGTPPTNVTLCVWRKGGKNGRMTGGGGGGADTCRLFCPKSALPKKKAETDKIMQQTDAVGWLGEGLLSP